ncbi:MAG TPA: hypothetical protein VEI81_00660 [Methanoregula sp.]|nr:hypothetical protein [Methanoregula sp.]
MYPFATHVTCRIRRYEESVNRLAEAMSLPEGLDSGSVSRPFCERSLVLALLGRISPDDPAQGGLADEAVRISGELATLGRAYGPRLYPALREELVACVDRYYSTAG